MFDLANFFKRFRIVADGSVVTAQEARHQRTAELAYEKFVKRNYQHGHDTDDWLEAEKEIDNA